MPTTRKESLYFGLMMCFGMVVVMTVYNMFVNQLFGVLSLGDILLQLVIAYAIALVLDVFLVGSLAKKIVSVLPFDKKKNIPLMIISMSTCMVFGMAFFMSFYGLVTSYLHAGLQTGSFIKDYLRIFGMNFIFALPLQLIVMGPIVRLLFIKLVKRTANASIAVSSNQ